MMELLKGRGGLWAPLSPQLFEKKYTSLYINKKNFNFGSKIYILAPPPQKIYKLTQEIQQIDNL